MTQPFRLAAIIEREDEGFVALCPEFDVASQGPSIEEARANLVEALSLFLETADPSEVEQRFRREIFLTTRSSAARSPASSGNLDWRGRSLKLANDAN